MSEQQALQEYCQSYFEAVGSNIIASKKDMICVQIPRDVDKELTDRPFYWMWVEAMNEQPPDTILYLKFSPDADESLAPELAKPELIVPGCYRLLRIYASAKTRGAFGTAYEKAPIVTPYALFNVKISFVSDRRKDFLESYAIDLRDYRVYGDAMKALEKRALFDERAPQTRIMAVPIDIDQIFHVLDQCIQIDVEARDHTWAKEAKTRLDDELRRLEEYYSTMLQQKNDHQPEAEMTSLNAEYELRKAEIIWRTEPKVEVRPMQFALVYLATAPISNI